MPDTSTLAPFAGVNALINQSVEQLLANAVARYHDGPEFGVLFDRGSIDGDFGGAIDMSRYTMSFNTANAPELEEGQQLLINGVMYRISGPVQPDASGWADVAVSPMGDW